MASGATLALAAVPAQAQVEGLEIVAPASPGGGWDQTARAMQAALEEEGLASGVQVQNISGAGGTIGLAQFVTGKKRGNNLLDRREARARPRNSRTQAQDSRT